MKISLIRKALFPIWKMKIPDCVKSGWPCTRKRSSDSCNTLEEAKEGVKSIMMDKKFGSAGNQMVVEEFMTGREVSVLSFVDGKTIKTILLLRITKEPETEIRD